MHLHFSEEKLEARQDRLLRTLAEAGLDGHRMG